MKAPLLRAWGLGSAAENGRMPELAPACLLLAAPLLLAACGGPQVRSLANGSGPPAFELRADSPAALHAQAERLCGGGYTVLRGAVAGTAAADDDAAGRWLIAGGQWISGMPANVAQATIVCRG